MSLFAEYKKEREGKYVLELDGGFAVYSIQDKRCWIEDIYVEPRLRRTGLASKLADMIKWAAKKEGCEKLLGTCQPDSRGATESMQAMLAYGFRLKLIQFPLIWLEMEID